MLGPDTQESLYKHYRLLARPMLKEMHFSPLRRPLFKRLVLSQVNTYDEGVVAIEQMIQDMVQHMISAKEQHEEPASTEER